MIFYNVTNVKSTTHHLRNALAERLCGEWKLYKILKTDRQSRPYILKDNILFCNVVFFHIHEQILKEGKSYLLEGWRNTTTRHNVVIIHEIN